MEDKKNGIQLIIVLAIAVIAVIVFFMVPMINNEDKKEETVAEQIDTDTKVTKAPVEVVDEVINKALEDANKELPTEEEIKAAVDKAEKDVDADADLNIKIELPTKVSDFIK